MVSRKYREYLTHLSDTVVTNPKRFFLFVRDLRKDKGGIPDLKQNGREISDPIEKTGILNSHFQSVFNNNIIELPQTVCPQEIKELSNIVLSEDEVSKAIKDLRLKAPMGYQ